MSPGQNFWRFGQVKTSQLTYYDESSSVSVSASKECKRANQHRLPVVSGRLNSAWRESNCSFFWCSKCPRMPGGRT